MNLCWLSARHHTKSVRHQTATVHIHHRHILLFLSLKADSHFHLSTEGRLSWCKRCSKCAAHAQAVYHSYCHVIHNYTVSQKTWTLVTLWHKVINTAFVVIFLYTYCIGRFSYWRDIEAVHNKCITDYQQTWCYCRYAYAVYHVSFVKCCVDVNKTQTVRLSSTQ